jgi:DNA polymerase
MAVLYGIDLTTLPGLVLPSADSKAIQKGSDAQWRAFVRGEDYNLDTDVFIACHVLVQAYRGANPRIDSLKRTLGKTVTTAVRNKGSVHEVGRCKIWCNADVLLVELPSGYRLCYWEPLIETAEEIDPETGESEQREYLSFKRARGKKMIRERSWPGLTLENIVQAIANQLLRYGKIELARHYPRTLVLAVHDEAVAEARIGAIKLKDYIGHLCRGWWWTNGLPLAADGWQGPRYGKR